MKIVAGLGYTYTSGSSSRESTPVKNGTEMLDDRDFRRLSDEGVKGVRDGLYVVDVPRKFYVWTRSEARLPV
jgi:hypothetical protein